jgi:hypothetical protein
VHRQVRINQKNLGTTQKNLGTIGKNLGTTRKNLGPNQKNLGIAQKNLETTQKNLGTTQKKLGSPPSGCFGRAFLGRLRTARRAFTCLQAHVNEHPKATSTPSYKEQSPCIVKSSMKGQGVRAAVLSCRTLPTGLPPTVCRISPGTCINEGGRRGLVQGYLAHKKQPPP